VAAGDGLSATLVAARLRLAGVLSSRMGLETMSAQTQRSIQSLGYALSPSGLDGGSPASEGSVAGFRQTGSLAANGSVTFLAFIFKNALAAYNGKGRADRI